MLLVPVMAVKVPFLVLLGLQQVSLSSLKQVLDMQDKVLQPLHGYQLGLPHPVVSVAALQW